MHSYGRMFRFIRELINERCIKVRVGGSILQCKQTDLGNPQGMVLSATLFLVAINGTLGELRNGKEMDHSLQMIWQYTLQQEIREW